MNYKVIFEDNKDSPISQLLKRVFGDCVDFAGNCHMLDDAIIRNIKSNTTVICYVDCPPDNNLSVSLYNELEMKYRESDNVYILKAQCIEYYMLSMLKDCGLLYKSDLTTEFINGFYGVEYSYSDSSFEKFCKRILNGQRLKCLNNKDKVKHSWYRDDCNNYEGKCLAYRKLSMYEKEVCCAEFLPYVPMLLKYMYLRNKDLMLNYDINKSIENCKEEFNIIKTKIVK